MSSTRSMHCASNERVCHSRQALASSTSRRSPCLSFRNHYKPSGAPRKQRYLTCHASESDEPIEGAQSLPIFPLGLVALPFSDIPLQIFEARYRVLFSTLLAGSEGVIEELVSDDSPFKGSKRFGMCYSDANGLARYGTVLEITEHQCMEDGRMLIQTRGCERFTIERVDQEKPVLICSVKMIEEEKDEEALTELADETRELFRHVMRMNARYKKIIVDVETLEPPQLESLKPSELSFWMVSMFAEAATHQQKMLEMDSAFMRLTEIKSALSESSKYLAAALALEGAIGGPSTIPDATDEDPGLKT